MVKHLASYKGCLKFPDLSPKLPLQIVKKNALQKTENRQESEADTTPDVMNINELLHPRNLTWRYHEIPIMLFPKVSQLPIQAVTPWR